MTIDEDGTSTIDVDGVVGKGCEDYTSTITKALGGTVLSDEKKPEYHQKQTNKQKSRS